MPSNRVERFERFRWEHPEWWLGVIAVAAWIVLLAPARLHGFASWAVMVGAMALPLATPGARRLAHRVLAVRRQRTVVLHAVAFAGVWLLLGAVAIAVVETLGLGYAAGAATLLAAAAWHVSPIRRRALRRCGAGRLPSVTGRAADLDCLRSGLAAARVTVVTHGLPMLTMAAVHSVSLALALSLLAAVECRPGPNADRRAGRPFEALALAGLGLAIAVTG